MERQAVATFGKFQQSAVLGDEAMGLCARSQRQELLVVRIAACWQISNRWSCNTAGNAAKTVDAGDLCFGIQCPFLQRVSKDPDQFGITFLINDDFGFTGIDQVLNRPDRSVIEYQPVQPDIGVQ